MRIILLCATRRGLRFLEKLSALSANNELVVVSSREEPGEPPFFEDICALANCNNYAFHEAKQAAVQRFREFWDLDNLLEGGYGSYWSVPVS